MSVVCVRSRLPHKLNRAVLLSAASSLLIAVHAPAKAVEAEADQVDEIVVTGSAMQNLAEIDARRNSLAILDTLSGDEIGSLPDLTIAESMRRIAGVTTIYNDDIGQFASVRGTHPDLIPVTLNGMTIATTGDLGEGTRKVNLQVIPGHAVKQIQAYKTLSADLDAGAMGGLINIVPISAFDSLDPVLIATAGLSYSTYMDVPDDNSAGHGKDSPVGYSANLLWADQFGPDGSFGVVVSGIYEVRPRTQSNDAITNRLYFNDEGGTTNPEAPDWNGFGAPNSFVSHNYTNRFEKYGGTIRLEYKPTDDFHSSLFGYGYFSSEEETRNTNRVYSLDQARDQTENTGTMRVRNADTQWRFNTFERDQMGVQWHTVAKTSDRGELSTNFSYSRAEFISERPFVSFVYKPNTRLSYDLENKDQLFVLDNAEAYQDPRNFMLGNTYHDWRAATENVYEARLDYGFNNKRDDRGLGFAVGANFRRLDLTRDNTAIYYETGSSSLEGLSFIPDFDLPGYSYPGLWIDQETFWGDTVNSVPVDAATSDYNTRINDYRYEESVYAAYASVNYTTDRMNLIGGLRFDHTKFDATMPQVVNGDLLAELVNKKGDYTKVLPYFTGVYSLTPSLRIKTGASQTLGRPNPQDIATVDNIDLTDLQITRGNPDLKPRRSTNLDLGLEYFFNGGQGMVTLTGFYKHVKDDIITLNAMEDIGGELWEISQPVNGEVTKYKGLELGFINNSFGGVHHWLRHVGASANLMLVDGETSFLYKGERRVRDDLQYQAKFAANAAVFYDFGGGSELRLAMNHQDGYVEEYASNPWQEIYIEPFTTFDLTAKWAVNENWLVRLEGRNIFSTNRYRNTGPEREYHRAGLEIGSSWFLRATYKM